MATSKTLAPTNVTISIPAMGDQPDASVFSNCIDKEADAINTLNSKLIEYTTMTSGTNLNSLTTKANYMVGNISQMTGAPTGCGSSGFFYVDIKSSYILQRFFGNLGSAHRFSYDGGSTWTNWFDPNSQMTKILASGAVDDGNISYDFSALSSRQLAMIVATNCIFIVTKWASNATANPAYRESGVAYSGNGNTISITGVATGAYSIILLK